MTAVRDEILCALRLAKELPSEQLARFLGDIEEVRCTALARLSSTPAPRASEPDQLLTVMDASQKLGVSRDYLYRHSHDFSFTRRMGRKLLFSKIGIERHIAQRGSLNARESRATLA